MAAKRLVLKRPYLFLAIVLAVFAAREGAVWYRESRMPNGTYVQVFGKILVLPSGYTLSLPSRSNKDELVFVPYHLKNGKVLAGSYSALSSGFLDWVTKSMMESKQRCGVQILEINSLGMTATFVHDTKEYVLFVGVPAEDIEFSLAAFCRLGRSS